MNTAQNQCARCGKELPAGPPPVAGTLCAGCAKARDAAWAADGSLGPQPAPGPLPWGWWTALTFAPPVASVLFRSSENISGSSILIAGPALSLVVGFWMAARFHRHPLAGVLLGLVYSLAVLALMLGAAMAGCSLIR